MPGPPGPLAVSPTSVSPGAVPGVERRLGGTSWPSCRTTHPCGPPIDHLCELLPRLQARYYSIASSSKVGPGPSPVEKTVLAPQRALGPGPQPQPLCPTSAGTFAQDSWAVYPEGWTVRSHPALRALVPRASQAARKGPEQGPRDGGGWQEGRGSRATLTPAHPQVHPNSVHILAPWPWSTKPRRRTNKGVATSWLRAKEPASENGGRALVPMYVRKSQFRLLLQGHHARHHGGLPAPGSPLS